MRNLHICVNHLLAFLCREDAVKIHQERSGRDGQEDEGSCQRAQGILKIESPFPETTLGMVFTRKRKTLAAPIEHSYLVGRAPSHYVVPSGGQIPPRDMVVIQ